MQVGRWSSKLYLHGTLYKIKKLSIVHLKKGAQGKGRIRAVTDNRVKKTAT